VRRRRLSLERTNDDEISDLMTRAFFLSLSGSGASCLLGLSGEAERDKHRSQPGTGGNSVPAPAPALVETVSFAAGAARNDAGCTAADAGNVCVVHTAPRYEEKWLATDGELQCSCCCLVVVE
jgi:hypothetical protein